LIFLQATGVALVNACCRRGIRTAHGAVSRDTKFGGLPQSTRVPALYRVCSVVTTPETGGHGCQVSSSYSIKELFFAIYSFIGE